MTMPKKLIIIDDHDFFRAGITECIKNDSDWNVVAQAKNRDEVLNIIENLKNGEIKRGENDIFAAIVDLSFRNSAQKIDEDYGFEIISLLKNEVPFVKPLVVSSHDTSGYVKRALDLGAAGYVSKQADAETLLDALGSVCRGEVYIQSDLVGDLLELKTLFGTFTKKEKQIAEILDLNITNAQISEKVGLSLGTVENYIGKLYDKTGTSTRAELLRKIGKL